MKLGLSIIAAWLSALACLGQAVAPLPSPAAEGHTNAALTIEQAFEMALASNEEAKLADLAVKQAALLPWRALSIILPNLTASAYRMYPEREIQGDAGNVVVADPTDRASVKLSQPLFNSDAFSAYKGSRYLTQAASDNRVFRLRELLFRVADAFIACLKQGHVVGINRETLKLAEEQQQTAAARYDAGEVPKTDVLRAEVEVSGARRELEVSQNKLQIALTELRILIGAEGPVRVRAPSEGLGISFEGDGSLEKLIQGALEQRDDVRGAANELEAARWALKKARRSWLPTVSFDLEETWADPASLSQPEDFWTATFRASLPVFEGGSRRLDIKEARYGLEQAELVYSQLVKTVRLQVTSAWLLGKTAKVLLEANRKELDLAVENYDVVSQRYRAGKATSLDQVDAFTQLSRARTSVANLTFDYQVAALNLLRQIGALGEHYVADKKDDSN